MQKAVSKRSLQGEPLMASDGVPEEFLNFSDTQWAEWITAFLRKDDPFPQVPVFEDRYAEELISLFRRLKDLSASDRFSRGLATAFESTPPEPAFAERIYFELHVMAVATSLYGRNVLRQRLREGTFEGLEFARTPLQPLLLAVNGAYPIDSWLADYIRRSTKEKLQELTGSSGLDVTSRNHLDFRNYVLLCWRLLARKDLLECSVYLNEVLPVLESKADHDMFGDELVMAAMDHGWIFLLELYVNASELAGVDRPDRLAVLAAVLGGYVIPFIEERSLLGSDAFFLVLEFLVNLNVKELNASQLYVVLGTVAAISSKEAKELCTRAVHLAYLQTGKTWNFMDHNTDDLWQFRHSENELALMVPGTDSRKGTHSMLHRDKDSGVLEVLTTIMPPPDSVLGNYSVRTSFLGRSSSQYPVN